MTSTPIYDELAAIHLADREPEKKDQPVAGQIHEPPTRPGRRRRPETGS